MDIESSSAGAIARGKLNVARYALATIALLLSASFQTTQAACPQPLQEPSSEQVRSAQGAARNRGFLWQVSKLGRTSYLYGTIHIARFEWMFPGPDVIKAVRAADTIALELNLLNDETLRSLSRGFKALDDAPPPAEFVNWARSRAEEYCLNYAELGKTRPENQIASVTMAMARQHGLAPEYGIDVMLTQAGKKMWKTVEGLETAEDQLNAFRSSRDDLNAALAKGDFSKEELDRGMTVLLKVATAWADSDLTTLSAYPKWCRCMNSTVERREFKRMLDDRNPKMATRIDEMHSAGRVIFAAVGSLHLVGDKGLPTLLAAKGYTVSRVF